MGAKDRIVQFLANGPKRTEWLNDKIGDGLDYVLGPTGIPDRLNAIGLLNPVQDIYEAGGNARDGDYTGAAINTASALMPVAGAKLAGGGLADDAANIISDTLTNVGTRAQGAMDAGQAFAADEFGGVGPSKGIRAYHGSPHDFDRFSMDAIGTGEGAQAYGHGLYFAENEGVARGYRDDLTAGLRLDGKPLDTVWIDEIRERWPQMYRGLSEPQAEQMDTLLGTMSGMESMRDMENAARSVGVERLFSQRVKPALAEAPAGRMYEVNINANPDDFLDWDAPLSEQPANVQEIARNMDLSGLSSRQRGKIQKWLNGTANELEMPTGNELHSMLTDFGTDGQRNAALTQRLASDGIPGIKYKDAGSRGADGGTRNFVVFDENLIEIVRKYGIAGAAAMLGVSASEVQAAMQQNNRDLANEITSRGVQ